MQACVLLQSGGMWLRLRHEQHELMSAAIHLCLSVRRSIGTISLSNLDIPRSDETLSLRNADRKQHKEDCSVIKKIAKNSPALQLIKDRLEVDPPLLAALLGLGTSLLNLHTQPEAYKTHYVRLEWSNRVVPGAPEPLYLEKYRVLPMSHATPDFMKDVRNVGTMKQPQIMFDFMLFGSEKFIDGPYNYSVNIQVPFREIIEVRDDQGS